MTDDISPFTACQPTQLSDEAQSAVSDEAQSAVSDEAQSAVSDEAVCCV